MRNAPAVSYPVGRSSFQGWIVMWIGISGVVVAMLWHQQADLASWRSALLAVSLLATLLAVFVAWRRAPCGRLSWDGHSWSWQVGDFTSAGVLGVHLDFQAFMVLSLRPQGGRAIWLWPQRSAQAESWQALRRAAFARDGEAQTEPVSPDADFLTH